jgi:retron-type reverse transcriptase
MSLLKELTIVLGLPRPELERIIITAPRRYKTYHIRKRNGGWRQIAHPSKELKTIQRFFLEHYLEKYPVHEAAMAYAKGRNIRANAEFHMMENVFLKLDFITFFPSIKASDWKKFLALTDVKAIEDTEDVELSTNILFWGAGSDKPTCLSIGAPTSPMISNILLFPLDMALAGLAVEHGVRYTRYADDITISGPTIDSVLAFERIVKQQVKDLKHPKLKFNRAKRGLYTRGQRRMVTGLVVTPDARVSLGRQRKRLISSLLHRSSLGQLELERRGVLKGLLGFAITNEPGFITRLRRKYGDRAVDDALRFYVPPRAF